MYPKGCYNYTTATIAATDRLIEASPESAAAAIRAIVNVQAALRQDPGLAYQIGRKFFPAYEQDLIVELIRRDLFYDAGLSTEFIAGMNQAARDLGLLQGDPPYRDVVAQQFSPLWR